MRTILIYRYTMTDITSGTSLTHTYHFFCPYETSFETLHPECSVDEPSEEALPFCSDNHALHGGQSILCLRLSFLRFIEVSCVVCFKPLLKDTGPLAKGKHAQACSITIIVKIWNDCRWLKDSFHQVNNHNVIATFQLCVAWSLFP